MVENSGGSDAEAAWTLISSAFGVTGNLLCVVVFSQPAMLKHPTTIFMIGLALSDTAFLITRVLLLYWPIPILTFNIVHAVMTCAAYFTILINVDRFIAVTYPFKAKSICTKERAVWLSIATVVTCFLVYQLTYWAVYFSNPNSNLALYPDLLCGILIFVIPFPILVVLNIRIGNELRKVSKSRSELDQSTAENRRKRRELALTRMLFVVVILFTISYAPYHIAGLTAIIFHIQISHLLHAITQALLQINSCINFIIYFAMGQQFRSCFKRVFGCEKKKNQRGESTRNGTLSSTVV